MQPENDNKDDDKRSFEFDFRLFGPNSIFNFILIFKTSYHHRHHLFHHYRLSATYHFSSTTTVTMIIPIRSTTPSPSSSQPFLRHRNVIPPLLHNYHHLKEHCLLNYCRRWQVDGQAVARLSSGTARTAVLQQEQFFALTGCLSATERPVTCSSSFSHSFSFLSRTSTTAELRDNSQRSPVLCWSLPFCLLLSFIRRLPSKRTCRLSVLAQPLLSTLS